MGNMLLKALSISSFFIIVAIIILAVVAGLIAFVIMQNLEKRQCSLCKKMGALKEIERKEIKTWTEFKTVEEKNPIFDKEGKETGDYVLAKRNIPIKCILYEVKMKCKNCGNIETKEETEKIENN